MNTKRCVAQTPYSYGERRGALGTPTTWLKRTFTLAIFAFISTSLFSQVLYVDGFDYPFGDKGYTVAEEEYSIAEQINAAWYTRVGYTNIEVNEMYPDYFSDDPNRGSTTAIGWYNASDVGDWAKSKGKGGIHPGEDWNKGLAGTDKDTIIRAIANGTIYDIRLLSENRYISAWAIIIEHTFPDESTKYSVYCHVTSLGGALGTICDSEDDFGFDIGDVVTRGQQIAKIANINGNASHLHLEIRTHYDPAHPNGLWPNGPGGRYPENLELYYESILSADVQAAYGEMQTDGIIDASDFIDAHRPSAYAVEYCGGPEMVWENTIGGSADDKFYAIAATPDNGAIAVGYSASPVSFDKQYALLGVADYWIVKIESDETLGWQKVYGGTGSEVAYDISPSLDGGYFICGYSNSNSSAYKEDNAIGASDYWIMKINSAGSIVWESTIGGSGNDFPESVTATSDGGCVVAGSSTSNTSGHKTEDNLGADDYWVVKLDNSGDYEWDNTLGGTTSDYSVGVVENPDGTYTIAGYSESNISLDKDENALVGSGDIWLVKLSSDGQTILNQETIGGSGGDAMLDFLALQDNTGYILGGYSASPVSFDKTEPAVGNQDYWIVKVDNDFNVVWDKTIGGTLDDITYSVEESDAGTYMVSGRSYSAVNGNKCLPNFGLYSTSDIWIMEINDDGEIVWQTVYGGNQNETEVDGTIASDGGYIVGATSYSPASGSKMEEKMGVNDYWIVKIDGEECVPTTEICNSLDDDCDGLIDEDTAPTVTITGEGGATITFCQGGNYTLTATHTGATLQWKKDGVNIAGATGTTYVATTSGVYTCVSTNACGSATSLSTTITVNPRPSANITASGATTFCMGSSVVLTANAGGGLSYQWYNGAVEISGATSISYTATTAGSYRCRVTKTATGCFRFSNTIPVFIICKEGEVYTEDTNIRVYPNPASGTLYLDMSDLGEYAGTVSVYSTVGQLVYTSHAAVGTVQSIDVSSLPVGAYTLTLTHPGGVQSLVFIIE